MITMFVLNVLLTGTFFDHIFLRCPLYWLPGNRFKSGGTLKLIHLSHYQKV